MQEPEVVKKKKGRPPKPKEEPPDETIDTEKKKRGRKKKEPAVEEVPKQKKKRGRKAAVKYFSSSIRKKIPLTTVIQDNDSCILHLDVKDNPEAEEESQTQTQERDEDTNHFLHDVHEIKNFLDNDKDIIGDYLDTTPATADVSDLRELYEKRIQFRETQDKHLVDKLEVLHKDEEFIEQLLHDMKKKTEKEPTVTDEKEIQNTNRKKGYFQLLHKFVQNSEWLEKTDCCCWWCCHKFDTVPLGLPIEYMNKFKKFRVRGVFCSFACMTAYKNDRNDMPNASYLIRYLQMKLTGEGLPGEPIDPAPPRCALKMFGGELTVDEFREATKQQRIYKMVEYPMFISRDYVEEVDIANIKSANTKLFDDATLTRAVNLDDQRVSDAKQRLSQMEKTTITLGNTIDRFIVS